MAGKKKVWKFTDWNEQADPISMVRWLDLFCDMKDGTDSPIEHAFGNALAVLWEQNSGSAASVVPGIKDVPTNFRAQPVGLNIWPQCKIGPYRVDFFLVLNGGDGFGSNLVIECDGHDFHEKTKEQAKRDKRRDRELSMAGTMVMRFTGSEINADPYGCAREAIYLLRSRYRDRT